MKFSINCYIDLLKDFKNCDYKFIFFDEGVGLLSRTSDSKHCILRHDVDNDLDAALKMALLEYKIGISSTYFLMVRSPIYNLFSRSNSDLVKEIIKLGHQIGLHYDHGYDVKRGMSASDTHKEVISHSQMIENEFGQKIKTVSYHQPSVAILNNEVDTPNFINTYDKSLSKYFKYFSDSNRKLSLTEDNNKFIDNLNLHKIIGDKNIQLLIHPMWWIYENKSTYSVWNSTIISNFENMQKQFLETEGAYGMPRRFKISE